MDGEGGGESGCMRATGYLYSRVFSIEIFKGWPF